MIIKQLVWDEWNINHIAKHDVDPEEAEEVCSSRNLFEKGRDGTYQIIGQTQNGRYLNIVVVPRKSGLYPVTARNADNKEKSRFKKKS